MKKIFHSLAIFCLFCFITVIFTKSAHAQQLDLVDFMASNFNYNGFTNNDSYLELTGHNYSFNSKKYLHTVPQTTCPAIYNGDCENVNWHFYYLGRKSPTQNIIYQSKIIWKANNLEVFWYNDQWIYDFMEPAFTDQCPVNDQKNPICFHNFYHNDDATFPNRGFLWYKRYFNSGEEILVPMNHVRNYKIENNNAQNYKETSWPASFAKAIYVSHWNNANFTWNNNMEYGYNLPQSLDVVILETTLRTPTKFKERYYYAKSANNTFGLIRYDRWEDINKDCSHNNCPGIITDNDPVLGTLALEEYGTLNVLTKFSSQNTTIDQAFIKSFYSDPKFEVTPSNGALSRGKIYVRSATTTDGRQITNNYMYLTEILTDGDWLISTQSRDSNNNFVDCPQGYKNQGSLVTDFYDHQGNFHQNSWAILCGTNTNVVFSSTCPTDYISRGSIDTTGYVKNSIYEYDPIHNTYNAVGGNTLNLCVKREEIQQSNKMLLPVISPTPTLLPGDLNDDNKVDILDLRQALSGVINIFNYNLVVGNFGQPSP